MHGRCVITVSNTAFAYMTLSSTEEGTFDDKLWSTWLVIVYFGWDSWQQTACSVSVIVGHLPALLSKICLKWVPACFFCFVFFSFLRMSLVSPCTPAVTNNTVADLFYSLITLTCQACKITPVKFISSCPFIVATFLFCPFPLSLPLLHFWLVWGCLCSE